MDGDERAVSEIKTFDVTFPITVDDLPKGLRWDKDGACFEAETCNPVTTGCEWRWAARNWKAFARGEPDYPLYDHLPFRLTLA